MKYSITLLFYATGVDSDGHLIMNAASTIFFKVVGKAQAMK